MKFSSLSVALVAIAFAEAHDVRVGTRGADESRGKPGKRERVKRERVRPKAVDSSDDEPSLIIGGSSVQEGEYPYYVNLQGCGASLIAPGVVLSAAHCEKRDGETVYINTIKRQGSSANTKTATVTTSVTHPNYNNGDGTEAWDFMLLKLDSAVTIDSNVKLAVNTDGSKPTEGQRLTVIGTGQVSVSGDNASGPASDVLLEVEKPVVNTDTCKTNFQQKEGSKVNGEMMFCAGGESGKDSCFGDSGGPIVIKDGNTHRQVGVVSWGPSRSIGGCNVQDLYGVYARVSAAMPWIKSVVCDQWKVSAADFCGGSAPSPTPPSPTAPTGSPPTSGCTDLSGWTDSYGDGCQYYKDTSGACDTYGDDEGTDGKTPKDACCTCGGGSSGSSTSGTGSSTGGGCTDLAGWTDSFGTDCSYYEETEGACDSCKDDVGTDGKTPVEACCVCQE